MKKIKLLITITLVLIITRGAMSQEAESCGMSFTSETLRELYYQYPQLQNEHKDVESFVENYLAPIARETTSKQLVEGLRKASIDVPDDYFDLKENQKINESFADHGLSEKFNHTMNNMIIYYQNVWITVHRSNTAQLISNDAIYEAMAQLNHGFATNNVPIRFHIKQINRVDNSTSNVNPTSSQLVQMALVNRDAQNRSLHLHIVDQIRGMGISGIAPFPMYHTTFMDNEHVLGQRNWTTFIHEFGHVLGLLHTHQGRSTRGYSWAADFDLNNEDMPKCRMESVSRSKKQGLFCDNTGTKKCRQNGDQFCDTQASPRFVDANYDDSTCRYTGTSDDKWSDRWRPQNTNYMSYAGECRTLFTAEQVAYMVGPGQPSNWALTAQPAYSISGPSHPCALSTHTFSVAGTRPSGVTRYNWVLPNGWSIVGAAHGTAIQAYINAGASSGQVVAMPNGINAMPVTKYASVKLIQLYTDGGSAKCTGSLYRLNASESASWSFSNGSWTIISGQNTSSITYTAGTGANTITATSTSCGRSVSQTSFGSSSNCGGLGGPILAGPTEGDATGGDGTSGDDIVSDDDITSDDGFHDAGEMSSPHIIKAYPNPSKGDFKLKLENEKLHKVTIIHGDQVFNQFYTRKSNVNLSLPNHNLPYIVVIETEGTSKTIKLISK